MKRNGLISILLISMGLMVFFSNTSFAAREKSENSNPPYYSKIIIPLPKAREAHMSKYNWQPGCPVPLSDLALLYLSYWGFDQKAHIGILVVNRSVAQEVTDIFREIYNQKFPIALMLPTDDRLFKGNDDASMAANNTSAFNCRPITGQPGTYSNHSYGLAIDINTMINPYVKGETILPPSGYLNRSQPVSGMISHGDAIYNAFIRRGWSWGGDWTTRQDYQHFEKPQHSTPVSS